MLTAPHRHCPCIESTVFMRNPQVLGSRMKILPGGAIMTIAGGFLFGPLVGSAAARASADPNPVTW